MARARFEAKFCYALRRNRYCAAYHRGRGQSRFRPPGGSCRHLQSRALHARNSHCARPLGGMVDGRHRRPREQNRRAPADGVTSCGRRHRHLNRRSSRIELRLSTAHRRRANVISYAMCLSDGLATRIQNASGKRSTRHPLRIRIPRRRPHFLSTGYCGSAWITNGSARESQ